MADRSTVRCGEVASVNKFVNAVAALHALQNVNDGFVAEQIAAFRVRDFAGVEEQQRVGFAGVDVQRAGLARVAKHLHHAGKVVMRQVAAEAGVRLRQHLRGLKTFRFADDDLLDVRGDDRGRTVPVDVVVAAGLKRFHQRALAAVAEGDDRAASHSWDRRE